MYERDKRMKILVVYQSKTGFARRYAEMIGTAVGAEVAEFRTASAEQMSKYDVVVYGAGLYAGRINGLAKAKETFQKSTAGKLVVFATGATPGEVTAKIEEVWSVNLPGEEAETIPHFYMQGGLNYEKMGFMDRLLMKMMANMLKKKENKDETDAGMEQAILSSFDSTSEDYIQPIVEYIRNQGSSAVATAE